MRIWCFAVRVYFPMYCFTFDRNLPRQSCQALGNCLFSLPWQLLVRRAALAHSLMLLLSALCSRQDTTCIQHFFSFSHLMHVYTYIYMWQCKCTVLWHSASAEMDRVLFIHLPALVSLFPSKKCSFFFFSFSIGTFTLYQPSFGMWVLLVLTNKVRLSVKCIPAISISCAASHWSWGSLSQCKTV